MNIVAKRHAHNIARAKIALVISLVNCLIISSFLLTSHAYAARTDAPALKQTQLRGTSFSHLPVTRDVPPARSITLEHIEVAQSIQDEQNGVSLISGKATLIRAYLSYNPSPPDNEPITVQGQVSIAIAGHANSVAARNSLTIDPSVQITLAQKRANLD